MLTTMLIGLFVALVTAEVTGVVPGGLIVPAYLALYLNQPGRIAATLAAAFLALGLFRASARYVLLFGRRRFVFLLLAGALIGQAWFLIWPSLLPASLDLRVIGWVIPGILANNLARQKMIRTLAALAAATVATWALAEVIALF
ncbi:MAG: poly-gamma-glutamate biosynthesis protein PgsC [Acidobacteriota bacterium]|jgi:poly-gamma-glutamate biosynthesis protein PgsC/CapC|nr:poly-gamma-glutamate biosynthesis protein PgsC [Acidobacteriota bacterium]OQB57046.1 MAG: Capsule biosynthesis protein CapC [Candidatus Aminicenantes bacterium ADurb.Bin147]HPL14874.1 poly-gamma-glutamate biosynthesis protein PgsC [Candidatus Aminicenantes bacterium]MDD8009660.1 poly-gamma-glutamate biosynthesis protein PgsC [Acidobacteriota bacterium]MDD8027929.1 poly-gamma-glutamate biosynthesis protein PgsC [Acidobacteriota bacterium]